MLLPRAIDRLCSSRGVMSRFRNKGELVMTMPLNPNGSLVEARSAKASADLESMFALHKMMVDEFAFLARELLDRATTETLLFNELLQKIDQAPYVKDFKTMWEEFGQYQNDFVRRDHERLMRLGERMIKTTSTLFPRAPLVMC